MCDPFTLSERNTGVVMVAWVVENHFPLPVLVRPLSAKLFRLVKASIFLYAYVISERKSNWLAYNAIEVF